MTTNCIKFNNDNIETAILNGFKIAVGVGFIARQWAIQFA